MPLQPGTSLGPYSVTAKIGEDGMGEVWQARDTTLDRDVALKVLPEAFTSDPDRLARFEREAKVLASLNHPNIGSIYGLEKAEGIRALVLELVEGPTLADRIKQGPIHIDEALPIAKQIRRSGWPAAPAGPGSRRGQAGRGGRESPAAPRDPVHSRQRRLGTPGGSTATSERAQGTEAEHTAPLHAEHRPPLRPKVGLRASTERIESRMPVRGVAVKRDSGPRHTSGGLTSETGWLRRVRRRGSGRQRPQSEAHQRRGAAAALGPAGPRDCQSAVPARISDMAVVPYRQDQAPRLDFWGSDIRNHTTEGDTLWVNYTTSHFSSRSLVFLKVAFQGSRITSDAGLLLVRELDERLGLETLISEI